MLKKFRKFASKGFSERGNGAFRDFVPSLSPSHLTPHTVETNFFEFHSTCQKVETSFLAVENTVEIWGEIVDNLVEGEKALKLKDKVL